MCLKLTFSEISHKLFWVYIYDGASVNVRKKNQIFFLHRFSKKMQNFFFSTVFPKKSRIFFLHRFSKNSRKKNSAFFWKKGGENKRFFFSAVHTCTIVYILYICIYYICLCLFNCRMYRQEACNDAAWTRLTS